MIRRAIHCAEILHFPDVEISAKHADTLPSDITLEEARRLGDVKISEDGIACQYFAEGALVIENGTVVRVDTAQKILADGSGDADIIHHQNTLLVPGFVDSHVHFPQTDIIASHGTSLLEWLQKYTFPAEIQYRDPAHCEVMAEFFLDCLLSNGVTTALVFATVHPCSAEALFAAAHRRNMRLFAGKVMMDRNAPSELLDTAESSLHDSRALAEKWHNCGRLGYAVTPRFAPTSTPEQLSAAGQLLEEIPGALLHTHLSENTNEINWVRELFPDAPHYLGVYDRFGLVGDRSVFAHCLHLCDEEWQQLSRASSAIAFCPTSNMFLGSGLFSWQTARAHKVRTGLGSDVGGGTSFSPLRVMDEAYKVARLRGESTEVLHLWHAASAGGAAALGVADKIGNFAVGKEADFIALNLAASPLLQRRLSQCKTLVEKMFALLVLGDETVVQKTYIAGDLANTW